MNFCKNENSFKKLLGLTLPLGGGFLLRNSFGTGEFKGELFNFRLKGEWCTIYPKGAESSEERSHIHLRWKNLRFAQVVEIEKRTPQLRFFEKEEDSQLDSKAPFVYVFPSFYDWGNEAKPIMENQNLYTEWVNNNGKSFNLV